MAALLRSIHFVCHASNVATKSDSLLSFLRHHGNQVWHL